MPEKNRRSWKKLRANELYRELSMVRRKSRALAASLKRGSSCSPDGSDEDEARASLRLGALVRTEVALRHVRARSRRR